MFHFEIVSSAVRSLEGSPGGLAGIQQLRTMSKSLLTARFLLAFTSQSTGWQLQGKLKKQTTELAQICRQATTPVNRAAK